MYIYSLNLTRQHNGKNNDPTGELSSGTGSTEVRRCLAVEGRNSAILLKQVQPCCLLSVHSPPLQPAQWTGLLEW